VKSDDSHEHLAIVRARSGRHRRVLSRERR
jgi:hypothetical protein